MSDTTKLGPIARFDALPGFRRLLLYLPAFREIFGQAVQFRLVLDASVVQKELRWRVRARRDPTARSGLHEAIDSGTIVALAPEVLKKEIEQHIDEIAQHGGVAVSRVREEWLAFQSRLFFYDPDSSRHLIGPCIDPDDLPYEEVRDQLGAQAIYTRDAHFEQMQVPAITVDLDLTLRDYARASSIQVAVKLGSGLTAMFSFQVLVAVVKGIAELSRRVPTGVKLALGLVLLLALLNRRRREAIASFLQSTNARFNEVRSPLTDTLADVASQYTAAEKTASKTLAEIQSHVPSKTKRTALVCARTVCLIHKDPLSIPEIERRMRNEGYVSTSRTFGAYLRRLFREDKGFVEVSAGFWTLWRPRTEGTTWRKLPFF